MEKSKLSCQNRAGLYKKKGLERHLRVPGRPQREMSGGAREAAERCLGVPRRPLRDVWGCQGGHREREMSGVPGRPLRALVTLFCSLPWAPRVPFNVRSPLGYTDYPDHKTSVQIVLWATSSQMTMQRLILKAWP